MEKKEKKVDESLRYSQACIDHRKKQLMPELTETNRKIVCDSRRSCYEEGCPLHDKEINQTAKENSKGREGTMVKNEKGGETFVENLKKQGVNLKVFQPMNDVQIQYIETDNEKQKKDKEKKISREIEDFLYLQSRVISKLAWNPQIWKALDNLSSQDILERLLGKTGLEGVATHAGGAMPLKTSKKTEKLFENLEKQFAEEDEKKGKAPPPKYEDVGVNTGFKMTWTEEPWFSKKEEEKEEKKNGKKNR